MFIVDTVFVAGVVLGSLIVAYVVIRSRYKKAGPDEALIVYGRRKVFGKKVLDTEGRAEGFRIVHGGGTFIWPGWESFERL
jgi:flotillin